MQGIRTNSSEKTASRRHSRLCFFTQRVEFHEVHMRRPARPLEIQRRRRCLINRINRVWCETSAGHSQDMIDTIVFGNVVFADGHAYVARSISNA